MPNWFREWRIRRLLTKRAWLQGYADAWSLKCNAASEHARIAQITERLRQLGHKEQDNG